MRKDEQNVLSCLSKTKYLHPDRSPCVLTAGNEDKTSGFNPLQAVVTQRSERRPGGSRDQETHCTIAKSS